MKPWMRMSLLLVLVLCAGGAGLVGPTHALAAIEGTQVTCQVHFLDGPNQGQTEPVTFNLALGGLFTADSSDYVGGASQSGSWSYTNANDTTVFFTFKAQLVSPPSTTLTVITTISVSMTTVVGTSQGTITDRSGHVLGVAHTTTTCPQFTPPT